MTAMKAVLDLYIDANILLMLAYLFWRAARTLFVDRVLRDDFRRQLTLLKSVLVITVLSPALAYAGVHISGWIAPNTPMTVSDIAVAVFLKGEIAVPAVSFEAFLNSRDNLVDAFIAGELPWLTAVFFVLMAGGLLHSLRLARSLSVLSGAVSGSFLWRATRRTDIRLSDRIDMPFASRGFRRRHVVVPISMMMRPKDLRVVLAHEFQHLRSGDVEWEMMFELLGPLFYWNPAFALWKREFDHMRELSCDQAVMVTKKISPEEYAGCLLDFCERRLNGDLPKAMNVAFVRTSTLHSARAFRNRILAIFKSPSGGGQMAFYASILALAVLVSLAAASVRKPGDWSHDRIMLSTIVNLERLEAINRGFQP